MRSIHGHGLGWNRDLPDMRDFTDASPSISKLLAKSVPLKTALKEVPANVDLRGFCSPIEDWRLLLQPATVGG